MISNILSFVANASNAMVQSEEVKKIRAKLIDCTYHNNIKFIIEKICLEIQKNHPQFDTQILAFSTFQQQPSTQSKITNLAASFRLVEKLYMMFNQYFPNKAPYLRIVNMDPNIPVNQKYGPCQSPNDKMSYVMNSHLNNLTSWHPGKSLLPVFSEIQYLFQKYPFYQQKKPKGIFGAIFGGSKKKQQKFYQQQPQQQYQQPQNLANRGSIYQTKEKNSSTKQPAQEQDYDSKQCKLCYNTKSEMINTSCGHVMMCELCFKAYAKKQGSNVCECPICKTRGQYVKYVQPKFA